jgi:alkanesulfonate monooxygenase SsuD/methylene tetrahydromethanopterin reductase-like flavin-dependent oxidoreductase (luciferase family)
MKVGIGPLTGQVPSWKDTELTEQYRNELDIIERADELGYDSAWLAEHHFVDDGHYSSPLSVAAAAGERTDDITLGTSVLLGPLYDPIRLAEDIATIDRLTRGRFVLGIGMGYREAEYRGLGVPTDDRVARLVETALVVDQAWDDEQPIDINGKVYSYDGVDVHPKPHTDGGPPVWIGATTEKAIRRAPKIGETWIAGQLFDRDGIRERFEWVREEADTDDIVAPVLIDGFVAESEPDAWETVADGIEHRIRNYLKWDDKEWSPERLERARRKGVFGDPETVAAELNEYDEAIDGEVHCILWFTYPGVDKAAVVESLELFAEEGFPLLND